MCFCRVAVTVIGCECSCADGGPLKIVTDDEGTDVAGSRRVRVQSREQIDELVDMSVAGGMRALWAREGAARCGAELRDCIVRRSNSRAVIFLCSAAAPFPFSASALPAPRWWRTPS